MNTKYHRQLVLILAIVSGAFGATIDTVSIYSEAMDSLLSNVVVIPDGNERTDQTFPVLYLLHGWSGGFSDWNNKMDLGKISDQYSIIIVCPEGGYSGWYLDSPVNNKNQFRTYVGEEVVAWIDTHYSTVRSRNGRAITGLSMGGHGSFYIASQFPDTFGAAGSMSGVMDLTQTRFSNDIRNLAGMEIIEDLNQISNVYQSKMLTPFNSRLILDCGVEDKYIHVNRNMHTNLLSSGIDHVYSERPGTHSWEYWTTTLPHHILFFKQVLNW